MNIIFSTNKIEKILYNTNNYYYYFIIEQDFLITQNIEKKIIKFYQQKKYNTLIKKKIISKIDYQKISFEFQQQNLFTNKKILLFTVLYEKLDINFINTIKKIYQYNNKNIILILKFQKLKYYNNIIFLKKIFYKYKIIIIHCIFLSQKEMKHWILKKIKKINLNITIEVVNMLSYYYKNNLLKLYKILKLLNIIFINHQKIKLQDIKDIIDEHMIFNITQWIYTLFTNNKIESLKILKYFRNNKNNILHIIKILKINLIYLIYKKENITYYNDNNFFLKKYIIKYDNINLNQILKNLNSIKLYKIINILHKIDYNIKNHNNHFSWIYLKTLISIFNI